MVPETRARSTRDIPGQGTRAVSTSTETLIVWHQGIDRTLNLPSSARCKPSSYLQFPTPTQTKMRDARIVSHSSLFGSLCCNRQLFYHGCSLYRRNTTRKDERKGCANLQHCCRQGKFVCRVCVYAIDPLLYNSTLTKTLTPGRRGFHSHQSRSSWDG